ncbi:MAG: substrate-binding domain-containing protein [Opitutales bacterium]|nr:substrate-binding domain-containing protein [Opitutales bacterium]
MDSSGHEPPHLPLFLNTREHWGRSIARGAVRAARLAVEWTPFLCESEASLEAKVKAPAAEVAWAGVIGQFYPPHHELLAGLRAAGIPVVNISSAPPPPGVGWIHCDDFACGAMAARHFLERGYCHFAFLGITGAHFSDERQRGFVETLRVEGRTGARTLAGHFSGDAGASAKLADELRALPAPCAVFAANDVRARHCLHAALGAGIAVPESLSILGVDDDDLQCNMARVALSSVCADWTRIGERAVEHLVRTSRTGRGRSRQEVVAPLGVTVRQSTDQLAVEDALAARALRRIHSWGQTKLSPENLAAELGVSRRTLERHLVHAVGRSVHAAIFEARLQRAYRMVVETSLPVGEIAARTGFSKHSHLNAAFKKRFSATPMSLRRAEALGK